MSNIRTSSQVKQAKVEATLIMADGSRVPMGVVAYHHKSFFKRLKWRVTKLFKGDHDPWQRY